MTDTVIIAPFNRSPGLSRSVRIPLVKRSIPLAPTRGQHDTGGFLKESWATHLKKCIQAWSSFSVDAKCKCKWPNVQTQNEGVMPSHATPKYSLEYTIQCVLASDIQRPIMIPNHDFAFEESMASHLQFCDKGLQGLPTTPKGVQPENANDVASGALTCMSDAKCKEKITSNHDRDNALHDCHGRAKNCSHILEVKKSATKSVCNNTLAGCEYVDTCLNQSGPLNQPP